jgi:hypothetical protein
MNKDTIIQKCITILRRDDVKQELNQLFIPIMDVILDKIQPYIYISLLFVLISFILHLGIFFLLFKNKIGGSKSS